MLTATHRTHWANALGTHLWLQLQAGDDPAAAAAADNVVERVFGEADAVLSTWRPDSEVSRWRRGEVDSPSADLTQVLTLAHSWWQRSGGLFHPDTGRLSALWDDAARTGRLPEPAALTAETERLRQLPFDVRGGVVVRTGDTSGIGIDAVAKGWIVDRAVEAVAALDGVDAVMLNCGGEVRHWGLGHEPVRIEDPLTPADNAPGLGQIALANAALATSSNVRRGREVGGVWYGHVLDPRSGWPVPRSRQASVMASDVATADAAATVAMLADSDERESLLGALLDDHAGWLVVDGDVRTTGGAWPSE